jgi:opacity protein-like surface antigen
MLSVSKSVLSGLSIGLLWSTGVQAQSAEEQAPASAPQGETTAPPASQEAAQPAAQPSAAPAVSATPADGGAQTREEIRASEAAGEGDAEAPSTYGTHRKLELSAVDVPENPKRFTASINGGSMWFDDATVSEQFVPYSPTIRLQIGRQFINQFQLQVDLQRTSDTGYNQAVEDDTSTTDETAKRSHKLSMLEDDTTTSGDQTTLSLYNFELGLAYRLDYFYEQPLVPYLQAGIQGSLVTLSSEDPATSGIESETGHRVGAYVGGGLELLLDTFEPARAADLELSSGINDTYLIIDARYNWLNKYVSDKSLVDATGLLFDGWQVTAGLKFDF